MILELSLRKISRSLSLGPGGKGFQATESAHTQSQRGVKQPGLEQILVLSWRQTGTSWWGGGDMGQ